MYRKQTKSSPFVNLSAKNCLFEIKGSSYKDDIFVLYDDVLKWVKTEIPEIRCELKCVFNFTVFNSVSFKSLIVIFTELNNFYKRGKRIEIHWYYDKDNEEDLEIMEEFKEFLEIPFKFIQNTSADNTYIVKS